MDGKVDFQKFDAQNEQCNPKGRLLTYQRELSMFAYTKTRGRTYHLCLTEVFNASRLFVIQRITV